MTVNTSDILDVVKTVTEQSGMTVTVQESAKGAAIIGASAFTGGLLGGPVGLGIGGLLGSLFATTQSMGKFKSIAHVIDTEMTQQQKNRLADSIRLIIANININDVAMLLSLFLSNADLKQLLLREVTNYMRSEMGYRLS